MVVASAFEQATIRFSYWPLGELAYNVFDYDNRDTCMNFLVELRAKWQLTGLFYILSLRRKNSLKITNFSLKFVSGS